MFFSPETFAALCLLLATVSSAPAGLGSQSACHALQSSSLKLNHVARTVSLKARNGSKDVADFSTSLVYLEAKDECDPGSLEKTPARCMGKILDVLGGYQSAVEQVSRFGSCTNFSNKVKQVIQKLHEDIRACAESRGYRLHEKHNSIEENPPVDGWQRSLLCQYVLDRLFSFSILTARVFAVGDPARHGAASAQRCPPISAP